MDLQHFLLLAHAIRSDRMRIFLGCPCLKLVDSF